MKALGDRAEREGLRLNQREDPFFILSRFSLQIQQLAEVFMNGFWRRNIFIAGQNLLSCTDGSRKQQGNFSFVFKNVYKAFCCRPFSFPVAAASRLKNRIQPCLFPKNSAEVHIHSSLDQGGRNHTAGKILL